MSAVKKSRLKKSAAPREAVPQNRDECAMLINVLGRLMREIAVCEARMNDELAAITDRYAEGIDERRLKLQGVQEAIHIFCEAHRDELTDGGKTKSGGFVTGTVMWRQRSPSVMVTGADSVIETLQRLGLSQFLRMKQEINKEAILNEPEAVKGVAGIAIKSGEEDFVISPFELDLV